MGYELNKLMQQFGVSTPGVVNYTGATVSAAPKEPTAPDTPEGVSGEGGVYPSLLKKYQDDLVAYNISLPQLRAQETADRAAYDAYRRAYQDRVANTPMYVDAQFQTGPSAAVAWNTAQGGGRDAVNKSITDWVAQYPTATPQQIRAAMDKYGISGYDVAQARGGSMWGEPLRPPTYGAQPVGGGINLSTTPTSGGSTVTLPNNLNIGGDFSGVDWSKLGNMNLDALDGRAQLPKLPEYPVALYADGGAVRKFQAGGARGEEEDPMETFLRERNLVESGEPLVAPAVVAEPAALRAVASPVTASPAAQPVTPPPAATTPVSPAAADLMSMLQRYAAQDSVYAPELKAARQRAEQESAAFQKMIADATKADTAPPDKTEMYFRLAAAFGAPTKTGHFSENLGMVGKELGEYAKERRTAAKADKQLRLQLGLEAQKLRAQGAREDLTTLRTLAGEEMKDKRAIMQEYLKSGRPQSEAGKIAQDTGLQPGTPEYNKFVNDYVERKMDSGELYKQAMLAVAQGNLAVTQAKESRAAESATKLTPAEVKLKSEAEVAVGSLDDAMGSLKRAYSLNPNTFDGTWSSIAQQKVLEQTDPKDPRVLATREQRNLLSKGAISNLRAAFGGNPTEGERNALLDLEGLDSKSKEERARIMKNTFSLLKQRRAREQKRLNEISQGLYRDTAPSAGDLE